MKWLRGKQPDSGARVLTALRKSDVGAFRKAVDDLYKVGGHIDIFRRDTAGGTPEHRAKLPIENAVTDEDLLTSIRKEYGDGIYSFKFFDANGDRKGEEHFLSLGDVKKETKRKKKDDDSSDGLKGQAALYAKMLEMQSNEKVALIEQQTKMMEMLHGKDNGMSQAELLQIITTTLSGSYDRGLELAKALQPQGDGTDPLQALLTGIEIGERRQPQVEREEPLTALLHSFLPIVGQLIAAKKGGGQVDANTIQQLQQILQTYKQSSGATPASLGAPAERSGLVNHPPPPGGSGRESAATAADGSPAPSGMSGLWGAPNANVNDAGAEPGRSASPAAGSQDYFYQRYVHPFRQDAASGQSDEALAYQIIAMVEYSRDQMGNDPSPVMVDFLTAGNLGDYEKAYYKFCAAIPELAQDTAKQETIKAALVRYLVPTDAQVNTDEEAVPSADMEGMESLITEDVETPDTAVVGHADAEERTEPADQSVVEGVVTQVQHDNV